MSRRVDHASLAGHRFGRLVATGGGTWIKGQAWHVFVCDCGTEKQIRLDRARKGIAQSCGCLKTEATRAMGLKYCGKPQFGAVRAMDIPAYRSWRAMCDRCHSPSSGQYPRYGAKGITVCDRWRKDFAAFYADMGDRPPGTSIDRIDGTKGYEPGNCRWATVAEQAANMRPPTCSRCGQRGHNVLSCAKVMKEVA